MIYDLALSPLQSCLLAALYPWLLFLLKNSSRQLPGILTVVFCVLAVYLGSRTAIICIFFSLYLFYRQEVKAVYQKWIFAAILISIPVLIILKFHSSLGRFFIWRVIIKNYKEIGWSGTGAGHFKLVYSQWQAHYFKTHPAWSLFHSTADAPSYAYNEWLHFGVEHGLVALIIGAGIIGLHIYWLICRKSALRFFATVSNSSILIFANVSYPLHSTWVVLLFIINLLVIVCSNLAYSWVGYVLAGISAIFFWYKHQQHKHASLLWEEVLTIPASETKTLDSMYGKIRFDLTKEPNFLKEYTAYLINTHRTDQAQKLLHECRYFFNPYERNMLLGTIAYNSRKFEEGRLYFREAYYIIPSRLLPLFWSWKSSLMAGDSCSALNQAQELLKVPVKVPSTTVSSIRKTAAEAVFYTKCK